MRARSFYVNRLKQFYLIFPVIVLVLIPLFVKDAYIQGIFIQIFFYAYLAEAWLILGGYCGQLNLGFAAFVGIGAYTSTILYMNLKITPWLGMLIGGGIAATLIAITGLLFFRLKGLFFAMASLALGQILLQTFILWNDLTGGPVGIMIPLISPSIIDFQFSKKVHYYYVILTMFLILVFIARKIEGSRLGHFFTAIRDDEDAAESIGIDSIRYKLYAAALSAFFAALGGTFYAQYRLYIEPHGMMGFDFTVAIITMAVIGGMYSYLGPIIGSFILTPISEILRLTLIVGRYGGISGLHLIVYGVILILVVIFNPRGLIVVLNKVYQSIWKGARSGG